MCALGVYGHSAVLAGCGRVAALDWSSSFARSTRVWIAGGTGERGRDSRNDGLEHAFERNEPDEQDSLAPAGDIDYA